MEKPIKVTPILEGKDALNFFRQLNTNASKKVDKEYLSQVRQNAQKLKAISK